MEDKKYLVDLGLGKTELKRLNGAQNGNTLFLKKF